MVKTTQSKRAQMTGPIDSGRAERLMYGRTAIAQVPPVTGGPMNRSLIALHRPLAAVVVAFAVTACGGSDALTPSRAVPTTAPPTPSASSSQAPSGMPALASPSIEATASSEVGPVPPGTIAFVRGGADGVQHYFTIRTDGSNERELFSAEG